MNALKAVAPDSRPVPPSAQPSTKELTKSFQKRRAKRRLHAGAKRTVAVEATVKLTINLLLATVAGSTLMNLVPHYRSQRVELEALQFAMSEAEQRKATVWQEFSQNFDPGQSDRIMQSQSGQNNPNQKHIVWINPLETP